MEQEKQITKPKQLVAEEEIPKKANNSYATVLAGLGAVAAYLLLDDKKEAEQTSNPPAERIQAPVPKVELQKTTNPGIRELYSPTKNTTQTANTSSDLSSEEVAQKLADFMKLMADEQVKHFDNLRFLTIEQQKNGTLIEKVSKITDIEKEDLLVHMLNFLIYSPEKLYELTHPRVKEILAGRDMESLVDILNLVGTYNRQMLPIPTLSMNEQTEEAVIDFSHARNNLANKEYLQYFQHMNKIEELTADVEDLLESVPKLDVKIPEHYSLILSIAEHAVRAFLILPNTASLYFIGTALAVVGESKLATQYLMNYIRFNNLDPDTKQPYIDLEVCKTKAIALINMISEDLNRVNHN